MDLGEPGNNTSRNIYWLNGAMLAIDVDMLRNVSKATAIPNASLFYGVVFAAIIPSIASVLIILFTADKEHGRHLGGAVAKALSLSGVLQTIAALGYWRLPAHIIVPIATTALLAVQMGTSLFALHSRKRMGMQKGDVKALEKFFAQTKKVLERQDWQSDPMALRRQVVKLRRTCQRLNSRFSFYQQLHEYVAQYVQHGETLIEALKDVEEKLSQSLKGTPSETDKHPNNQGIVRDLCSALQQYTQNLQYATQEEVDSWESGNK